MFAYQTACTRGKGLCLYFFPCTHFSSSDSCNNMPLVFFNCLIEVLLLCNVLVSAVQQGESAIVVVQLLSCVRLWILWAIVCLVSLSFTISWSLLKFMCIELVMLSNHLVLCHPLLLLPSVLPSSRVSSSESALHLRGQSIGAYTYIPFLLNLPPTPVPFL